MPRHLLLAGMSVGALAVLAHLAAAASILTVRPHLGLGAIGVGLIVVVLIKVVLMNAIAHSRLSRDTPNVTRMIDSYADTTRGRLVRGAHSYDKLVTLMMLGQDRRLRQQTIDLARLAPGDDVLEIGCGTGEVALQAKRRLGSTGSVAGIDLSPEMIAVARQKAARLGVEIDYRVAAVEALPFADSTFDMVLSSLMMHHLPDELKPRALTEIQRVLKPGGRLLVVDFSPPTSRLGRLAPVWQLHRSTAGSLERTTASLEQAGLTLVENGAVGVSSIGYVMAQTST